MMGMPQTEGQPLQQGGFMDALRGRMGGLWDAYRSMPADERLAATLPLIASLNQTRPHGQELNTMGRLAEGLGSGMQMRQGVQSFKAQLGQHKLQAEQRKEIRQAAADALKTIDVDGDGNISPAEQARADKLRLAITTSDARYINEAADMVGEMGSSGPFKGTSLEAQALNNIIKNVPPEQQATAIAELSRQRAEKGLATPMGMVPGYDLSALGGDRDPAQAIPKPITEGEARTRYAASSMLDAEKAAADVISSGYDPTSPTNLLGRASNFLASEGQQQFRAAADEFATNLVFLRSGATARQEEKDSAFNNFWPQPGDSPRTILYKEVLRKEQMANAYESGWREGRVQGPEVKETLARLKRQAMAAKIKFDSHKGDEYDDLPE